ncbi:TRAP transporter small permease subunit [Candidatus Omnitrophota bacterium]
MNCLSQSFRWIDKSIGVGCRILELTASIMLISIILFTVVDISMRAAGRMSIVGVLEVTEVLMAGIVFLVLAAVQRRDQHVKIDFMLERLPEKARLMVRCTILLLAIVISTLFLWQSILVSYDSWLTQEFRHGLLPVPIWPARFMVTIGFLFLSMQLLIDLVHHVRRLQSNTFNVGYKSDLADTI